MKIPSSEIRRAFYARILCALPLGQLTEDDVAWPNTNFKPRAERIFIAPHCLFNETEIASCGSAGFERLEGIFQINIYGLPGRGEGGLDDLAGAFTELLRGGTRIRLEGYEPVIIRRAWRTGINMENGEDGVGRPWVAVSASWYQYTQKGE